MATVNNTIQLQDKMSKTLNGLIRKLNQTQNAMNKMGKQAVFNDQEMQVSIIKTKAAVEAFMQTEGLAIHQTNKLGQTAAKNAGHFEKLNKKLIANFSIGAIIASMVMGAIFGLGNLAKQAIQTASDLVEVQNVVNVAYQGSTKAVDEWSKHTLDAYGINELNAKRYAGTMSAMLQSTGLTGRQAGEMSMRLTELAGDLASFYNIDTKVAFSKIRSGMAGMVRPLQDLGINMHVANLQTEAYAMGINKKWKAMTSAEKELVRYNYLMKHTQAIQGDFSRTFLSFANQQRLATQNWEMFTAHIATFFLPAMALGLLAVNGFIKGLEGLGKVINFLAPYLVGIGAVLLVTQIPAITAAISSWILWGYTAVQTAATVAASWLVANWPIALGIAGVIAFIAVMQKLGIKFEQITGFCGGVMFGLGAVIGNVVLTIRQAFANMAIFCLDVLSKIAAGIDSTFGSNLQDSVNKWKTGVEEYKKGIPNYIDIGKAYQKGNKFGEKLGLDIKKGVGQLFKQPNFGLGKGGFGNENANAIKGPDGSKNNPLYTKLSDSDIKALVEVAKINYVNKFIKMKPSLHVKTGDIRETADLNNIIGHLADMLEEAHNTALGGAY